MECVMHLQFCSAMGETEIMNYTFELADVENDLLNSGERMILALFTRAQTETYGQYLATVAREAA